MVPRTPETPALRLLPFLTRCGKTEREFLFPMKTIIRFLFAVTAMLRVSMSADAATIGINFGDSASALASGDSAGFVPQINWQNITTSNATAVTLFENTDSNTSAATSAQLSFAGSLLPNVQATGFVSGPDEKLNNGYVASFSNPLTLSITGVPYASYDVIAYVFTPGSGRHYSAAIGSTTLWGAMPTTPTGAGYIDNNNSTPFTYTSAVGSSAGTATAGGDYYLFSGLSGSALTISMNTSDDLSTITALQIVQTPEPARSVLLLGGSCALCLRRRRGKK